MLKSITTIRWSSSFTNIFDCRHPVYWRDFLFICYMKIQPFILLILLCSCAGEPSQSNADNEPESSQKTDSLAEPSPEPEAEKKPINTTLTAENHVEVLKEFWQNNPERKVRLETDKGTIDIRLFDQTPIHSSTFLMLTKRNYFNGTLFTRVVPEFIIQGGSSDQEELELKRMIIGSFNPEPEFHDDLIHQRGMVSMARRYKNNPDKLSSPYNFFIVVGRTFNTPAIMGIERDHDKSFSAAEKEIYRTIGGAPHLDGEHTVFGEVISGMEVVDAISKVETDIREWPVEDIAIIEAKPLP